MICPRCKSYRPVLDYDRMAQTVEYEGDTHAIYKCPPKRDGCSWIFSPAEPAIREALL